MAPAAFLAVLLPITSGQVTTAEIDTISERIRAVRKVCGPVAVYYCLQRLGYEIPLSQVVDRALVNEQGMTVSAVLDLIRTCEPSLHPRAISLNPDAFRSLPVPSILILDGHCVVYDGFRTDDRMVVVFDPARRRTVHVTESELKRAWTGGAIVFGDLDISPRAFWAAVVLAAVVVMLFGWSCLLWCSGRNRGKYAAVSGQDNRSGFGEF